MDIIQTVPDIYMKMKRPSSTSTDVEPGTVMIVFIVPIRELESMSG
jgi:hypothetical protein